VVGAVLTRNPLKWHPKREPVLEFNGLIIHIPDGNFGPSRYAIIDKEDNREWVRIEIPTWSGEWQRAALRQIGATDEDITAAIVYARLMGETV